jgi:uncharacterized repeat protein (TIGR01451 family)
VFSETSTIVEVVEGEVSCVDFPEWAVKDGITNELCFGIIVKLKGEDIAVVDIFTKEVSAYIPDDVKKEIAGRLVPSAFVLLRRNTRRVYQTEWDIVAAAQNVKAGNKFQNDTVEELGFEEAVLTIEKWEKMQIFHTRIYDSMSSTRYAIGQGLNVTNYTFPETEREKRDIYPEITFASSNPPLPSTDRLTITTPEVLLGATENMPYSQTLSASGGNPPYAWSIVSNRLPSGLTMGADGVISGTPDRMAIHGHNPMIFTVRVTDKAGDTAEKVFSIKISGYVASTWTRVMSNGFDGPSNSAVMALPKFNGSLYAGTENNTQGCEVWTLNNDGTWGIVSNNGFDGDINNTVVRSSCVFYNNLCMGTGNHATGGELWFSNDGALWTKNATDGFGDVHNVDLSSICAFDTLIYVGTSNYASGAQIKRANAPSVPGNWGPSVIGNGWGNPNNITIFSMSVFNGYLYAGTHNNVSGGEIWRSNNPTGIANWEKVVDQGFGNTQNISIFSLITVNLGDGNYLYASTKNGVTGAEIWRTNDGVNWKKIGGRDSDFNPPDIVQFGSFEALNGYLYVVGRNGSVERPQLWRTCNGIIWEPIGAGEEQLGFGDPNNRFTLQLGYFNDALYAGTINPANGAQIWRSNPDAYIDPLVTGRIYDSKTGEAIDSATVSVYSQGVTSPLKTCSTNPYRFNMDSGYYYLRVEKEGYTFPSNVINKGTASGDHGEVFIASGTELVIDLPVDKGYPLEVIKTANKKQVTNGEVITFQIQIRNLSLWPVSNIQINDQITNGFKYIEDSAYLNSTKIDNPEFVGRNPYFKISSLDGHKTTYITYQTYVGTGMSTGQYKTRAMATDYVRNWQMSNETSYTVLVTDDPLFTRGTIIGKVFLDTNGNGIQDPLRPAEASRAGTPAIESSEAGRAGEPGIAGVRIYTEYGVCVETDSDGKYHIADVPAGNHLLKVDPSSLPSVSKFTTENPYYVKITEGLLVKVNFGVTEEPLTHPSPIRVEDVQSTGEVATCKKSPVNDLKKILEQFFIVALAEGEIRGINSSGNIEMVDKDDRYDDGINVDGRVALFLKGKVLGKYLITASADTERRHGGRYDTKKLFTNLDPDKYYPVYGDASTVDYSGNDTQDPVYVLIEWDESFAKWGSFNTEIPLYERTISGGIINYKSVGKTKFGDDKTKIKAFGAFSRQKPAHDEHIGTGGSLYYLRHRDVIEGSEKIRVEVRDRISRRTLSVIYLREEIDYEVDYDSGRILLKRPLNSVTQPYGGNIISNDLLAGSQAYLVIDYEYYSDSMSNQAEGVKASQWIGDHVRVGGTYIQEERPDAPYKLMGGDATVKVNQKIEVNGSYNRTEETLLDNGISYDGGITFTEEGDDFSKDKDGSAVNVNTSIGVFDNTDVYLEYSREDPYYSTSGSISNQGSQKYIADIISKLTKNVTAGLSHVTQRYHEMTFGEETLGATQSHTTTGLLNYTKGKWDLRGEYQHQEVSNSVAQDYYTYFGTLSLLKNDFIGVRVGYELFSWLHPYIRGQITVNGPSNDQATIGSAVKIWDKGELDLSYTKGTIGDSALLGLTTRYGEDADAYTNIETGNNLQLGRYVKTSYGQTTYTKEGDKIYCVTDYSTYREQFAEGNIIGYDKKINDIMTLGLTYERAHINNRRIAIDRDSGSACISYFNEDFFEGIKGFHKLELRYDKGSTETHQWLTQNDILLKATKGLNLSGRANWGWTDNYTEDLDLAQFYEIGPGFSYRPPLWDKLNVLGKYSYIMDIGPQSQTDFIGTNESIKNVYSLEGVYDICRFLSVVGKAVYRAMSEKVGPRDWVDSDTYLYLGRFNFHVTKKWDIALEYRTLANKQIEDNKSGWLIEVDRDITDYIRFGVGYNFTDYDDDLRDEDNWDAKGWFAKVVGKY